MKKLKILYLEDSEHDVEIVKRALKKGGFEFSIKLVDSQKEYEDALGEYDPDLILADHSLFEFNSLQALKLFKACRLNIPFILVTGTVSEEFAVTILKEGADDYLLKDNLARLPKAINNALEKFHNDKLRQQYLEDIVANEALLSEAEKMAGIGSWQADMITGAIKWSDQQIRIYGYEPGEIEPSHEKFLSHIHPEDREWLINNINEAMATLDDYQCEFRIIDKSGNIKHIFSKLVIERNADREPIRLVGFNQDITERNLSKIQLNQLNENLQKQARELAISNIELERFAHVASHDLQEPLRMVNSFMDLLAKKMDGQLDEISRQYIHFAVDGTERMKSLIQALLEYSRVGTNHDEFINTDLNDVMQYATRVLEEEIKSKGAVITVEPLPVIKANKILITQLFVNLVSNAIKYQSDAIPVIKVGCSREQDKDVFYISDNGIGIEPKFFEKIFIIFQRLHNRSDYPGKGIGLSVCKKIVEIHKGKIWVQSEPGKGSTFYFSLPNYIL